MLTLTTITYKLDKRFRLEFTNDWEGKYYHLPIINGDLTPLCYIPPASSGSVLCISGIPTGYSSSRIYELLVKNTYWIGKIYLLDAPKWLMDKIEEVEACNEDFGLSFAIEKNNANNIHNITPNLSKYIPEDNAVLFLSEQDMEKYKDYFPSNHIGLYINDGKNDDTFIANNTESLINGIVEVKKGNITIFLPHGTQSELQKANEIEIEKELKEKYGVEEVNLFALHWFLYQNTESAYRRMMIKNLGYNKIITTNSTGILKPEDSTERLQVIDCKVMLEEYLKENNQFNINFMNQKHPSRFAALESHSNISVRELGVLNLNIDHFSHEGKALETGILLNTCETIEIIDISTMAMLFQVQIPKVKTWQISVLLTSTKWEMKFSTIEEAFDFIDNKLFQKMIESEAMERELCPEIAKLRNLHLEGMHEKLSTDLKMEALRKNPLSQITL